MIALLRRFIVILINIFVITPAGGSNPGSSSELELDQHQYESAYILRYQSKEEV